MASEVVKQPRTLSPEKAKEIRARRDEVMARIDAVLAELLPIYGKGN